MEEPQVNTGLKLATALLAGCAIGAAVVEGVHAQAKPPAFTVAEIDVFDPEGFQEFAKLNTASVAAAGGRFLALRGRVASSEGVPPKGVAIIAWDSLDQATEYFSSPTFKELIPLRDRSARVRLFHVEGLTK
jgi:uncharacterized protein (DUF1330 family)